MVSSAALRALRYLALSAVFALLAPSLVAGPAADQAAPVLSRITSPVSDASLTTLRGNVHPLAKARFDRGPAPAALSSGRMTLLLRPSDAQQTALHRYLDELQNPHAAHYHQWLTPENYGKRYGLGDADLATLKTWLQAQGFHVQNVPAARNRIVFSGTVGAIRSAFHTSIHSYLVHGEQHYSNATDPQIPSALAPVIAGISPMNDFRARPQHTVRSKAVYDAQAKRIRPAFSDASNDLLYLLPSDASTIYNTPNKTLNINATLSYDGSGIAIGILGYSNLQLADVLNYRTAFLNDADSSHLPTVIVDGDQDPGVITGSYADEALLDNEIAGGLAPGAAVNYYIAASDTLQDGLVYAAERALDDNAVSILSVSYSACELDLQASGNLLYSQLWEQAAAQGITVVVASGDSGSADCDDPGSETSAVGGLGVSGLASTPYDIAVGGTDFAVLPGSFTSYVSTSIGTSPNFAGAPPFYETALAYIPEVPWNDSLVTDAALASNVAYKDKNGDTNIAATGGGQSTEALCSGAVSADGSCAGTLSGYAKPGFQGSLTAADSTRDLPDVSFFAGNGAYGAAWVVCSDNVSDANTTDTYTDCQSSGGALVSGATFAGYGGTSTATPAFAGMLAIIAQSQGGARLGQAANVIYNLAAANPLFFHDTVVGNNSVPCTAASPDCNDAGFLSGFDTATGYDLATGLGSLDIAQATSLWAGAIFKTTATTLQVGTSAASVGTGSLSITHGTPVVVDVAVTPSSVAGDVSVTNTSGLTNNAASFTNMVTVGSSGTGTFTTNNLPGGTYDLSAYYGGDATHSPSTSAVIALTVAPEASTTALTFDLRDPQASATLYSNGTMPYGFYGYVDVQPYGKSSSTVNGSILPDGVATGTVALSVNSATAVSLALNSLGHALSPLGSLVPGSYSFQATYPGDPSLAASASGAHQFTITQGATGLTAQPASASILAASSTTVVVVLSTDSLAATPTGTIALSGNGVSFAAGQSASITMADGTVALQETFAIPASQLAVGANTLTATYPGDTNYIGSTTTTTINVTGSPMFTVAGPSGGLTISAPGQSQTGTITITPANGFTGAVTLSCSVTAAASGTAPTCSVASPATVATGAAVTAVLTVSTTAGTSAFNSTPLRRFFAGGGGVALGCLLLFGIPARRRGWRGMALLLVLVIGAAGCGGSSSGTKATPGTSAGTYTVTVTGSGSTGSLSSSAQVMVVVQ